ncbi:fungal-specific transcription factor domain-containing protein [Talaromyces proteolyticus]|uniref:Fungal-specific transcription factor domain-containing protein n=1 Tax=Talaromyces proteolyticus TaxID=1131652 RepID=A0AAD4PY57_9EURO|nr:fungal-specific transcription factor domain-containing protein [Talaromyces proteolyticus]KAH8697394.1 fungal-specific transcription factor domain-containing protein [Talaromyces proteolyticus]
MSEITDSSSKTRIRAACRRCQRRKIKCGGEFPSCGACQKASVPCVREGKQEVQRSYITGIEQRVKWLESLIREIRPELNLEDGPGGMNNIPSQSFMQEGVPLPSPNSPLRFNNTITTHSDETTGDIFPSHQNGLQMENAAEMPRYRQMKQAHEIGLVSLSPGGEARYIGPSSGYFFADLVFSRAGRRSQARPKPRTAEKFPHLVESPVANLPTREEDAIRISSNYFQTTHLAYPFLHEHSHMQNIHQIYEGSARAIPQVSFHVYMVLAIASSNLSRQHKIQFPADGYFNTAMKYFPELCAENSLKGVQCLLLLIVYALHNPSCHVNIWNLLYQCLASLIDLGLQRDIKALPSLEVSLLEQEMRTRVFWVIYTLDRTLAILMGRPIGIRDEACELRLPMDISDAQYETGSTQERSQEDTPTHITYAIHLFKLARLNSEIKYVMHSICREPPAYAYPPIRDMRTWQKEIEERLNSWSSGISANSCSEIAVKLAEIKYHEAIILIHRPNPSIPEPSEDSLHVCFRHATEVLRKYGVLYRTDDSPLLYTRLTVHSVFLSTLIMLYAVWKISEIAAQVCKSFEQFIADLKTASNVLSSIGEHWLEAKKTRDCVDELSDATVKWLLSSRLQLAETASHNTDAQTAIVPQNTEQSAKTAPSPAGFDPFEFLEDPNSLMSSTEWSDLPDFDNLMWEILNFR